MLHLANPNLAPPGSFRLRLPELAAIDPHLANVGPFHALHDLENEINKRLVANGLAPLADAAVQDRLCQSLPPGSCWDELGQPTVDPGASSLSLADVLQGTRSLFSWFVNGRRRVSADEVVRRSYICNSCPLHRQIIGCQSCAGAPLRGLVNDIVGGQPLPTDTMLGSCGVCHCSLVAKTRMLASDVLPHMSSEQRKQLWEKCWLRDNVEAA